MKAMNLFMTLVLLSVTTCGYSQTQNFNCSLFEDIVKGFKLQRERLKIYNSIKDKVYITADSNGMNPRVVNVSNLPNRVIDSLVTLSDFSNITDDSLYYEREFNLVIDTFNFFTKNCDCIKKDKVYMFTNNFDTSQQVSNANIIEVKGIAVKNDSLIIILKSRKSRFYISFYFRLELNKIFLVKIRSADYE